MSKKNNLSNKIDNKEKGALEAAYSKNGLRLLGIDEVGRGCLAGPVFAAAVSIDYVKLQKLDDPSRKLIRDSKTLSHRQRQKAIPLIFDICTEWSVGRADVKEIESEGIVKATFHAMNRAYMNMKKDYDLILIDGNQTNPFISLEQKTIIGGDGLCFSIAAASILAKESRDKFMRDLSLEFPEYDFAQNVGYGTKSHLTALKKFGITPAHRRNFAPIGELARLGH